MFEFTIPIQSSADEFTRARKDRSLGKNKVAYTNQSTIHNHICFRLLITTFIFYMLDAATDEVTTGSVSFNQLCDNISVLFACFLAMFLSCWMYALLSAAPTVASATLMTHCTPYFRPVPTVLPLTSTNPSLPLSSEAPHLHLNYRT